MSNISIEDFKKLLEDHDWYYGFSDDHRSWERGNKTLLAIKQHMKERPELQELYVAKGNEMFKTY